VSEVLAAAELYDAGPLKAHALAFIARHSVAVMKTDGWANLVRNAGLVNLVVRESLSALPLEPPPRPDSADDEWD
jgi:hypothetical protein